MIIFPLLYLGISIFAPFEIMEYLAHSDSKNSSLFIQEDFSTQGALAMQGLLFLFWGSAFLFGIIFIPIGIYILVKNYNSTRRG